MNIGVQLRNFIKRSIPSTSRFHLKQHRCINIEYVNNNYRQRRHKTYNFPHIRYLAPFLGLPAVPHNHPPTDEEKELLDELAKKTVDITKVRLLLKSGANPNIRNQYGWCPLHDACIRGNIVLAKLLLRFGADPNIKDQYNGLSGYTHDNEKAIRRSSLNENMRNTDYSGFTPLHYAVMNDDTKLVKVLIENNADPGAVTRKNIKPGDFSADTEISNLLVQAEESIKKKHLLSLQGFLEKKIIGQREAIKQVTEASQRNELGWQGDKPLVMLFVGSSGIGKTETAKQLAAFKNGGTAKQSDFVRIDMSEFQERHEVAKFIGAPPGYIGYEDGGQLTKALTKNPQAVVLLDEVEKAHPDVLNIMLQLFDEGRLTDGKGNTVTCPRATFVMTTNVGADQMASHLGPLSEGFKSGVMYPLFKEAFRRNEFLGRINEIVYFLPFTDEESCSMVLRELEVIRDAVLKQDITFSWEEQAVSLLARAFDPKFGARSLKNEISQKVLNRIAHMYLHNQISPGSNVELIVKGESLGFLTS